MGSIKVILGENGKGKTRFLLDYYNRNRFDKHIAVISNSLINPFPMARPNSKNHIFDLKARDSTVPGFFARSLNNYFSQLLRRHPTKDLLYILNHIGFDDEFFISRKPLYAVHHYINRLTNEGEYKLVHSQNNKADYYPHNALNSGTSLTPGFAEKLANFLKLPQEFHLQYDNHEIQHQNFIDHLKLENEIKRDVAFLRIRPIFKTVFYFKKNGHTFPLEYASSGELYMLALGLFIRNFLDDNSKSNASKTILIDEPENSLHPKWQREYVGFLQGFIGYNENVDVIIATHSPLIAMENDNYNNKITLLGINNGRLFTLAHNENNNNIEQIYYELFGVLTPKNRYLSDYCNNLLRDFAEHRVSFEHARNALISMREASFDDKQKKFLVDVVTLLEKLRGEING
jgi:hypothetical protein